MPDFTLDDIRQALAGRTLPQTPPSPMASALAEPIAPNVNLGQRFAPQVPLPPDPANDPSGRVEQPYWTGSDQMLRDFTTVRDNPDPITKVLAAGSQYMMPEVGMIKAYHGSPYDFDAFDMSKIGTGEGAQAYGRGLYFAENPSVAHDYRTKLSKAKVSHPDYGENLSADNLDHALLAITSRAAPELPKQTIETIAANVGDGLLNSDDIDHMIKFVRQSDWSAAEKKGWLGALNKAKEFKVEKNPGHSYEVGIDAHPDEFLDWDKPLSEQPKAVQDALSKTPGISPEHLKSKVLTGETIIPQTPEAMQAMRDVGIKGIRYLDQGSRNAGGWHITPPSATVSGKWMVKSSDYNSKGLMFDTEAEARKALQEKIGGQTHNYVVFDDKTISILKKYGIAGLTAGLGGAAAASGIYPTEQPKKGPTPVAIMGTRG